MRAHAPAADRNKAPILDVLLRVLPERGVLLEIASGTGQHVEHFARAMPRWTFRPSDPDPDAVASIGHRVADAGLSNVEPARQIDVTAPGWDEDPVDAIVCINMIHIAPWEAALALIAGAARCLRPAGALVCYGPFRFDGAFSAPSNEAFDESLRGRDPRWGVRDVADVDAVAGEHGLARVETIAMPANNHVLVFRATAERPPHRSH